MHVLIAADDFFPDPGSGGAGRYIHEIGWRLVNRGYDVSVITRNRGELDAFERISGINVYRHDLFSIDQKPYYWKIKDQLEKDIDIETVDLLNFHGPVSSLAVHLVTPNDIPRVYTYHSPWSEEFSTKRQEKHRFGPWYIANIELRKRIERRLVNSSDVVITLSQYMRERMKKHHGSGPRTEIIPGGVDIERFRPARRGTTHTDKAKFNILTVRRLVPRMGIDTLIRSLKILMGNQEGCHLYIGGDGPLREDLEELSVKLGVGSSVTFLGFIPEDELSQVYREMDLFVLPTNTLEGFGLVTLEALASGTPVLATSAGATPELLAPLDSSEKIRAPMLCETSNPDALAEHIGKWASLPEADRRTASQECRRYVVENLNWTKTTVRLEKLFRELVYSEPGLKE